MTFTSKPYAIGATLLVVCCGLAFIGPKLVPALKAQPLRSAQALPSSEPAPVEPATQPAGNGQRRYENPQLHFSLLYPEDLRILEYEEYGNAHTITFENHGDGRGFQVYVVPFEGTEISRQLIERDTASVAMKDPTEITVGGVKGTAFFSANVSIGESREVWFVRDGLLYEVVTYKRFDAWLTGILTTWQFI